MDIYYYFILVVAASLLVLGFIEAIRIFASALGQWAFDRYRSQQWYCPPQGKDKEEKEWGLIKDALLLRKDPLVVCKRKLKEIVREYAVAGSVFIFLLLPLFLCLFVPEIDRLFGKLRQHPNILTPVAILVSAVMVAIGTYYTIRVNGRASSRQKWIKKVRLILAELASGMPQPDSDQDLCQRNKSEQKFRKLELHLNPSEKMHRSLLYAISLAYGVEWLDDEEVEKNLCLRRADEWRDNAGRKAGIIRLSQMLLKREWEQTKNLR